jgi:hypothetical protein
LYRLLLKCPKSVGQLVQPMCPKFQPLAAARRRCPMEHRTTAVPLHTGALPLKNEFTIYGVASPVVRSACLQLGHHRPGSSTSVYERIFGPNLRFACCRISTARLRTESALRLLPNLHGSSQYFRLLPNLHDMTDLDPAIIDSVFLS